MRDEESGGGTTGKDRFVAAVTALCRGNAGDEARELTDLSAYLVACGLTSDTVAMATLTRFRKRLMMPTLGGFHELRLIDEQRHEAKRVADSQAQSMVRLAAKTRLGELDRKRSQLRTRFVRGDGVWPTRNKEIRAQRRMGVYLDIKQREELFEALASTPTVKPVPTIPHNLAELGAAAAMRGQKEFRKVTLPPRVKSVVESLPTRDEPAEIRPLPEMYTATLMHSARLYDRLQLAYHRAGRALDEVRLQFDAEREVVGLSRDVCRMRDTAVAAGRSRSSDGPAFSMQTGLGTSMDAIWAEIVDRAVALSELVHSAEQRAERVQAEARRFEKIARQTGAPRPQTTRDTDIQDATEHLAKGGGDRMLSTEAMRRLRGQLDPDDQ